MMYTQFIESSYVKGTVRKQTVNDFLAACAFVDKIKKFSHELSF